MSVPDQAVQAAATALGLNLTDTLSANVLRDDGTVGHLCEEVGDLLARALEAGRA